MKNSIPIVAIIGRPNVGKSTIFNRFVGAKKAVVEDFAGTTRDRLYAEMEWSGKRANLIDTGGIPDEKGKNAIDKGLLIQVEEAIEEADVLAFVVDGKEGITVLDDVALQMIRKAHKPVVLLVNKIDSPKEEPALAEFYSLGVGEPYPISALSGRYTGDALDQIFSHLPDTPIEEEIETDGEHLKIAIIGRPNVGKSTLLNQILGKERSVVSDVPGTTRDTVDALFEIQGQKVEIIDTAGIRRKGKTGKGIEHYSVLRAHHAISRSDVVFMLFDAYEGITNQDLHILGYAIDKHKAVILVANKWDLVKDRARDNDEDLDKLVKEYEKSTREQAKFVPFAPFMTISALSNLRVHKLLFKAVEIFQSRFVRISKENLRSILMPAIQKRVPPAKRGKALEFFHFKQTGVNPPTIEIYVSEPAHLHFSYLRYLENTIREVYPFDGTPIKFEIKKWQGK